MAIQPINVGSNPNDKTGDKLRDGFIKINSSFVEVTGVTTSLQTQINNFPSSFRGNISLSSATPTLSGIYVPTESGTYTNFGGIVIDLTAGYNTITYNSAITGSTAYAKQVVPINLVAYAQLTSPSFSGTPTAPTAPASATTQLTNGSFVSTYYPKKTDFNLEYSNNLFDKTSFNSNINDYQKDFALGSTNLLVSEIGAGTTKYYDIPSGTTSISYAGLGTSSNRRIAFVNDSFTTVLINSTNATNGNQLVPSGATKFRMCFKRSGDSEEVIDTFMFNFGTPKPYEEYSFKIVSMNLNGVIVPFNSGDEQPVEEVSINWKYNNINASTTGTDLFKQFTVLSNLDSDGDVIGCTGSSYNEDNDTFVISRYAYAKPAQLWLYKRKDLITYSGTGTINPSPTRTIDVSNYIGYIQGNVYDSELKGYWIIGTELGGTPTSLPNKRKIILVNDEGYLLDQFDFEYLANPIEAGQIALSPNSKNILFKPNNLKRMFEIDKITKTQIREVLIYETNKEGICVDKKKNEVWIGGDGGYVWRYDYSTMTMQEQITFATLPNGSTQNVEGMLIDPIDGSLCIVADAYLHGLNNNGNGMWVFDFFKTIKKSLSFPEMYKLIDNQSPIIDFNTFTSTLETAVSNVGLIQYRSSNTAPTYPLVTRTNWRDLPFYDGWGTTVPSGWTNTLPTKRYIQLRVVI